MSNAKPTRVLVTALSATVIALVTAVPTRADESAPAAAGGVVVKLKEAVSIDAVAAAFPVQVERPLLASRGVYLLTVTDPVIGEDPKKTSELAKQIDHAEGVEYAEPNLDTTISDRRYHGWPDGDPVDGGTDPAQWQSQPVTDYLNLTTAHRISTGVGSVVAVLDTGADANHPALAGHLAAGYDYVDDDSDPSDDAEGIDSNDNGIADEAHGHGTFVAGTVALVAPDTTILPMRVLDSDGSGNIFVLAEAINDAVNAGADVINLSLGTATKDESKLLDEVIKKATERGVVFVAAAGNAGSQNREYPAQNKEVIGVASMVNDGQALSAFSNWGDWVSVAAPGDRVYGPMPGGRYAWWSGTSMAAPQVSGELALLGNRGLDSKKRVEAVTHNTYKIKDKEGRKIKNGSIDLLSSLTDSKGK